ncbi:MAG: hypothetical protein IPJ03_15365 [Ignavibacteriales bacterium]|nr:hypothetical protein [Ignavibacteriales bacterium]
MEVIRREYVLEKGSAQLLKAGIQVLRMGERGDSRFCTTWKTADDGYYLIDM